MVNKKAWKGVIKSVEELGSVLADLVKWHQRPERRAKEVAAASALVSKAVQVLSKSSLLLAPPALAQVCLKLKIPSNLLKLVLWMLPETSSPGSHAQDDNIPHDVTQMQLVVEPALHLLQMLTDTVAFTDSQKRTLAAHFVAISEHGPPGEPPGGPPAIYQAMINRLGCR